VRGITWGVVNNYGLAASELARVREKNIPLTVAVDKVAASGGYLMACTANKILCAPFGIVGSIGVVAQVPNFNRLLKKYDVDYKEYTAGDYKRTVSLFGEITPKGEEKFLSQLEQTHQLFKTFVSRYRPQLDVQKVGTGEYWFGEQCLELKLIDQIKTSDDYILDASKERTVLKVKYEKKQPISEKISGILGGALELAFEKIVAKMEPVQRLMR
jgi:serine protease SohB